MSAAVKTAPARCEVCGSVYVPEWLRQCPRTGLAECPECARQCDQDHECCCPRCWGEPA